MSRSYVVKYRIDVQVPDLGKVNTTCSGITVHKSMFPGLDTEGTMQNED